MAGLQGRLLGGYQLAERIGSGSIAEVYLAHPRTGARDVVVKVIYPEFARQPYFLSNFRQMVQATGKLANHPHILPLLASGEESGYVYLVSPYVAAGTLRDWQQQGGRLGAKDAGPFFHQLCGALAYAHSLGLVHGNLKPSNVFLFEGRHVLLGDFGLLWDIRQLDMNHTGSGTEAVQYLAPEAFQGQVTQASDIYSLGAVLFAALVGQPPFQGTRASDIYAAHLQQPPPPLTQIDPTLAPPVALLDPVVRRAMAKQPAERYPAAMAVVQAIAATLTSSAAAPAGATPARAPAMGLAPAPGVPMPQLDPPFPPLLPTQHADEQMEVGRPYMPTTQATTRMPTHAATIADAAHVQPAAAETHQPLPTTMRVPASPASARSPDAPPGGWPAPAASYAALLPAVRLDRAKTPGPAGAARGAAADAQPVKWGHGARPLPDGAQRPQVPFSATQLGLPRLTAPALHGISDNWSDGPSQELADYPSSEHGAYGDAYSAAYRAAESPVPDRWADSPASASYDARAGGARSSDNASGESAAWSAQHSAVHAAGDARDATARGWDGATSGASLPAHGRAAAHDDGARYRAADDDSSEEASFTSQHVWTRGTTAARARRKRARRRASVLLAALLLVLVLGSAGALYARPSVCSLSACARVSALERRYLPVLGTAQSVSAAGLALAPDAVTLAVAANATGTATLYLNNSGTSAQTWQGASSLPWVSVAPTQGTVAAGGAAALAVTAVPRGISPGTYTAALTITTGQQTIAAHASIAVSAGAQLAVRPTSLTYAACAAPQTITIANAGTVVLTYHATPSVSGALSLSSSSGEVPAGGSAVLTAAITCQAPQGQDYAIIVVSNGGSMSVGIHYS